MTVTEYLNKQEPDRKKLMTAINKIILETNKKVEPRIGNMMGKEMILYEIEGAFAYALASVKTHMSLHNIIMYGHAPLYAKYSKSLSKAKFQKGCINFKSAEQMPLDVVKNFMEDSAKAAPVYLEMYKARMAKKK
ncbi:MAG TPA: hypothetical protein VNY36_01345 [Bacteroidia bacterium]|jgi:hypothetical protein|nr:hypothetical protein [Bacteroidia bacterium]